MRSTLHIQKDDGAYEPVPELRFPEPVLTEYQKAMLTRLTAYVQPVRGRSKSVVLAMLAEAAATWPHGLRCTRQ